MALDKVATLKLQKYFRIENPNVFSRKLKAALEKFLELDHMEEFEHTLPTPSCPPTSRPHHPPFTIQLKNIKQVKVIQVQHKLYILFTETRNTIMFFDDFDYTKADNTPITFNTHLISLIPSVTELFCHSFPAIDHWLHQRNHYEVEMIQNQVQSEIIENRSLLLLKMNQSATCIAQQQLPDQSEQNPLQQLLLRTRPGEEQTRSNWKILPDELWRSIFSYFTVNERCANVEVVCWKWYDMSSNDRYYWTGQLASVRQETESALALDSKTAYLLFRFNEHYSINSQRTKLLSLCSRNDLTLDEINDQIPGLSKNSGLRLELFKNKDGEVKDASFVSTNHRLGSYCLVLPFILFFTHWKRHGKMHLEKTVTRSALVSILCGVIRHISWSKYHDSSRKFKKTSAKYPMSILYSITSLLCCSILAMY